VFCARSSFIIVCHRTSQFPHGDRCAQSGLSCTTIVSRSLPCSLFLFLLSLSHSLFIVPHGSRSLSWGVCHLKSPKPGSVEHRPTPRVVRVHHTLLLLTQPHTMGTTRPSSHNISPYLICVTHLAQGISLCHSYEARKKQSWWP
jgi:hypothetical protein